MTGSECGLPEWVWEGRGNNFYRIDFTCRAINLMPPTWLGGKASLTAGSCRLAASATQKRLREKRVAQTRPGWVWIRMRQERRQELRVEGGAHTRQALHLPFPSPDPEEREKALEQGLVAAERNLWLGHLTLKVRRLTERG